MNWQNNSSLVDTLEHTQKKGNDKGKKAKGEGEMFYLYLIEMSKKTHCR